MGYPINSSVDDIPRQPIAPTPKPAPRPKPLPPTKHKPHSAKVSVDHQDIQKQDHVQSDTRVPTRNTKTPAPNKGKNTHDKKQYVADQPIDTTSDDISSDNDSDIDIDIGETAVPMRPKPKPPVAQHTKPDTRIHKQPIPDQYPPTSDDDSSGISATVDTDTTNQPVSALRHKPKPTKKEEKLLKFWQI